MQSSWQPQVMRAQIQNLPPALERVPPRAEQQKGVWHSFLSIKGISVFDCCCICCWKQLLHLLELCISWSNCLWKLWIQTSWQLKFGFLDFFIVTWLYLCFSFWTWVVWNFLQVSYNRNVVHTLAQTPCLSWFINAQIWRLVSKVLWDCMYLAWNDISELYIHEGKVLSFIGMFKAPSSWIYKRYLYTTQLKKEGYRYFLFARNTLWTLLIIKTFSQHLHGLSI